MTPTATVHLFDVEPDLAEFLSANQRAESSALRLPTLTVGHGPVEFSELLAAADSFAAIVLDGMLLQQLRVGEQVGLRLLGPGDVVSFTRRPGSMLLSNAECRVVEDVRLALFGRDVLLACHRWPRLQLGVYARVAEQSDRLAAQLVICQLPRVDQRLLAIMWLMAESWGHVTRVGTSLPVNLTHDVLGGLVGARRSTVTLALGELAERGALIRQDRGWLLLEEPPTVTGEFPRIDEPRLVEDVGDGWRRALDPLSQPEPEPDGSQLIDLVARLREEHVASRHKMNAQLARFRELRVEGTLGQRVRR